MPKEITNNVPSQVNVNPVDPVVETATSPVPGPGPVDSDQLIHQDFNDVDDLIDKELSEISKSLDRLARRDLHPEPARLNGDHNDWAMIDSNSQSHAGSQLEALQLDGAGCLVRSSSVSSNGHLAESICFVPDVEIVLRRDGTRGFALQKVGFKG